jgi:hypothetical protein
VRRVPSPSSVWNAAMGCWRPVVPRRPVPARRADLSVVGCLEGPAAVRQSRCRRPRSRHAAARARHSPWPAAACAASSKRFHIDAIQVGAEARAPRFRACRLSSDTPPRTSGSTQSSCCEESSPPSATLGADRRRTANADASRGRKHADGHSAGTRSHLASGRPPDTLGRPLRWRIDAETAPNPWETADAARPYTTNCGVLKQPDKHKKVLHSFSSERVVSSFNSLNTNVISSALGRRRDVCDNLMLIARKLLILNAERCPSG